MHDLVMSLVGGALIGLAATLLLATHGRIAGITGIVAGLMRRPVAGFRVWFTLGLVATGIVVAQLRPELIGTPELGLGAVALGGFFVGSGTRLANGCTSGHGVCGIARLSRRSIVATLTFMATGVLTVLVLRLAGAYA